MRNIDMGIDQIQATQEQSLFSAFLYSKFEKMRAFLELWRKR